ncbi:hypothetical protein CR513_59239, partial [Mucuna pruriens]
MVDALSRRHTLLAMLKTKLLGFESLKDLYVTDADFSKAYDHYAISTNGGECLCMPKSSIQELLVKEAHEEGFIGHFGMRCDVQHMCEKCLVYKMAKSKASSNGLYIPFPIPTTP